MNAQAGQADHDTTAEASVENMTFQAEVSRLLDLMVNALYSNKEIFLRELISNASDACDRLRYLAITEPDLLEEDPDLKVTIAIDKKKRTITVADNGIGMNRDDLIENLGTIARSGTAAFVDKLTGDQSKDMAMIGQFGVGFYSAFMVADDVTVISAKAGEKEAWQWQSDGQGAYSIQPVERHRRGTEIRLHLRKGQNEFLEPDRLRRIIKTYSDHIALPIALSAGGETETVNSASALWMRPKSEISQEQYTEFYHHTAHAFDEPWLTLHNRAEGRLEYASLLFIPSTPPFDLFDTQRKHRVKLYVRRVFITDNCEELMPAWLRFVTGVVDSEDLPLNISREMLQHNPIVTRIRKALVKRILNELEKKAKKESEAYAAFWSNFGAVLKEGLYEDQDHREKLLGLLRCHSTHGDDLTSLADYVERMKPGQPAIYYITGEELDALRDSPQIEGLRARGVEVLLLDDPIDEFWTNMVDSFEDKPFKSATRGDIDWDALDTESAETAEKGNGKDGAESDLGALIAAFKQALGDAVKVVRESKRLKDSPVCLVADEGGLDIHLERMLKRHNKLDATSAKILELNPRNPVVGALAERARTNALDPTLSDAAKLLLDQARIIEGEPLPDPAAFSRRMTAMLEKGLNGG